jgi:hypothetical protein
MKRLRSIFRWIAERLKDVFYDTDNEHLDGPRLATYAAIATEIAAAYHNKQLKVAIDLGPGGLGGGLGTILTAGAAFWIGKAYAKKKNREAAAIAQNTAVAVDAGTPVVEVAPPVAPVKKP